MISQKLFLFSPILKQTLWGGTDILRYKSLPPTLDRVGESWELSSLPGCESVVSDGECRGMRLTEVLAECGVELMGARNLARFGASFPLLVKFIDAHADLSVQVHPDDALAWRRHGCSGKTEMWYVVDACPGACLLSGFSRKITPDEYERRVRECTLPDVLQRYEVSRGDVFYLPAGRVHSIGSGCFICEIQQSSDITYRIYDFGRTNAQGNARQLHIEEAREAIDFSVSREEPSPRPGDDELTRLVSSPYFTTSFCHVTKPLHRSLADLDSFLIVVCTRGACTVRHDAEAVRLRAGTTLLASASCSGLEYLPHDEADILECFV